MVISHQHLHMKKEEMGGLLFEEASVLAERRRDVSLLCSRVSLKSRASHLSEASTME